MAVGVGINTISDREHSEEEEREEEQVVAAAPIVRSNNQGGLQFSQATFKSPPAKVNSPSPQVERKPAQQPLSTETSKSLALGTSQEISRPLTADDSNPVESPAQGGVVNAIASLVSNYQCSTAAATIGGSAVLWFLASGDPFRAVALLAAMLILGNRTAEMDKDWRESRQSNDEVAFA